MKTKYKKSKVILKACLNARCVQAYEHTDYMPLYMHVNVFAHTVDSLYNIGIKSIVSATAIFIYTFCIYSRIRSLASIGHLIVFIYEFAILGLGLGICIYRRICSRMSARFSITTIRKDI